MPEVKDTVVATPTTLHGSDATKPGYVSKSAALAFLNVEDGATADQTGAEIKAAYEAELNTNAYTDADAAAVGALGTASTAATEDFATGAEGDLATTAVQPGDSWATLDGTAWRVAYTNGTGDVTELALGADGTFLKSNGATAAPTFATPAGSGDVSKVGTPADNQVGVWTGDGTIEGTSGLTYTGSVLAVTGTVDAANTFVATAVLTSGPYAASSGDLVLTDTNAVGAFTVNLPASPSVGDVVGILDVTDNWATANITVGRNASNIEGAASDLTLDGGRYAELRYAGGTTGWVLNFVSNAATAADNSITNAKLDDMANATIKGRTTAGAGDPEDLTATQVRTLINVENGATANSADATLLARANHTGTQTASTISDFDTEVANNSAVTANTAKVTNATHTGHVTGATSLTIASDVITNAMVNSAAGIAFSKLSGVAADTVGQGQHHLFVPAGSMISRTTSGAEAATAELATNDVMLDYMAFDTAADEFAQFAIQMPKSWNEGTIVAQFIWSHPSTATNFDVSFFLQAVALANDDAGDTAFGTAVGVTDTGGTTDDIYITAETAAITVAGTPGNEEYVIFQVYRDVSGPGASNLGVDARLHGVKIHYTTNAATDD